MFHQLSSKLGRTGTYHGESNLGGPIRAFLHCAEDQAVRSALLLLVGIALVCSLSGCSRKAPGPAECEDMALRWAGVGSEKSAGAAVMLRRPSSDAEIAQLIDLCLTTPFDRALLRCVHSGQSPHLCLRAFEARRRAPGESQ